MFFKELLVICFATTLLLTQRTAQLDPDARAHTSHLCIGATTAPLPASPHILPHFLAYLELLGCSRFLTPALLCIPSPSRFKSYNTPRSHQNLTKVSKNDS